MARVPSKDAFQKKLGERIVALRELAGLTQDQLALKCDKDKQNLNRLEKGRINPTAFYLAEIAAGLGVPVKELLDFE